MVLDMGDTDFFECRRAQYADAETSWTWGDVNWSVGDTEDIVCRLLRLRWIARGRVEACLGPVGQSSNSLDRSDP